MDPVISVRDLRMRYGENDVLTGVDFEISAGEVVCLLGPNGAGKTTTIEILEGFRIRSAGEVTCSARIPCRATEDWRAQVGVVLQSWRDHPRWTPRRLLTQLGAYYLPYTTPDRPRPYDADLLLETVGLTEHADVRSTRSRAASAAGSTSPSASSGVPSCCSSTSRPRASIRRHDGSSTTWSGGCRVPKGRRSCSPPTTWTRPRSSPTGCWSSPAAGSSLTTASTDWRAGSRARPRCAGSSTAKRSRESVADGTRFVRDLFAEYGEAVA